MEPENRPSKPSALSNWALNFIKEGILSLKIPPGAQLKVEDLAEQMDISRTPVREALLWLERDGLVKTVPRVGFFVAEITRRDLEELFEIRELLEGYAAKKAASLLTDADLEHMDRLFEDSVRAVDQGNMGEFLEAEIEFHSSLVEHAQNQHLIEMAESIRGLTYRERLLSLESLENVRASLAEHQQVLAALHQRDGELAGRFVREHLRAVKDRMLQFVDLP